MPEAPLTSCPTSRSPRHVLTPSHRRGQPWKGEDPLTGRKILIVDDDVRNVFALTCVLERYGIEVLYAENGREGIDTLDRNEDVALVLMDVMMPETGRLRHHRRDPPDAAVRRSADHRADR